MTIFDDLKSSLSSILEFDYRKGEDSARRRVQLDFMKDFVNYENMLNNLEKNKTKNE